MRNLNLVSVSELADIVSSMSNYDGLCSYISQLDPKQEGCKVIYERLVSHSADKKYADHRSYDVWSTIDLHVINQMWGNTSGGWQGMGGAAMTNAYTVVIENSALSIVCIYYGGKLAYILDMDEVYLELISSGYKRLPGLGSVKRTKLKTLYTSK